MNLKITEKANVADAVYEEMKHMILSGAWKSGEKIPGENQLAAHFGVSRVSVRNAIHLLCGAGVLVAKHGDGTYVNDLFSGAFESHMVQQLLLSKPKLIEVLKLRMMLEVGAIGLAAKNATPEDISLLEALDREISLETDTKAFAQKDLKYHNMIAVLSKNSLLVRVVSAIQDIYISAMEETILLRGMETGRGNHHALTEAIAEHDSQKAEDAMKAHIGAVIDMLEA